MILLRKNGKYSLEVNDISKEKLINGLTQIALMLKDDANSNDDALFVTELLEANIDC